MIAAITSVDVAITTTTTTTTTISKKIILSDAPNLKVVVAAVLVTITNTEYVKFVT